LPEIPAGNVAFEWALDQQYLVQRSVSPQPEFPDSIATVAYDVDADSYVQHYFDSRGVVRIYRMERRDRLWTLLRTEADFSPLNFWQRFEGSLSAGATTIEG